MTSRCTASRLTLLVTMVSKDCQSVGALNGSRSVWRSEMALARLRSRSVTNSNGGEFDRCQIIRAVGVRKPVDLRLPSGRGHRYPQMVERSAATDERFSRGLVGVHYSTWIEE